MQSDGPVTNPVLEVSFAQTQAINTVVWGLLQEAREDTGSHARRKVWIDVLRAANGNWSKADWNVLAITARVMLHGNPAYGEVLRIAAEHGA